MDIGSSEGKGSRIRTMEEMREGGQEGGCIVMGRMCRSL